MVLQFTIRQCEESDIPNLNQFVKSFRHLIETEYLETAFQEQKDGKRIVLLAFCDCVLAGYVHLNFYPLYAPFARLNIPEIQDLFVSPDWRRNGVAAQLIKVCEAEAQSRGATEIGIGVGVTGNFGSAQRLYMRMGFMPNGAGAVFDRIPITHGDMRPIDDRMCLMMVKPIS